MVQIFGLNTVQSVYWMESGLYYGTYLLSYRWFNHDIITWVLMPFGFSILHPPHSSTFVPIDRLTHQSLRGKFVWVVSLVLSYSCLLCFELQLSPLFWATVVSLVLSYSCLPCSELQLSPLFWATDVSLVLSYSCLPCSELQLSHLFWATVIFLVELQLSPLFWATFVSLVLSYQKSRGLRVTTGLQSPEFSQPTEHNHTASLVFADCVITNEEQQAK
jgi:hypothetical protein